MPACRLGFIGGDAVSNKTRRPNPLKNKKLPAELVAQLNTEAVIATIVTALVNGKGGLKVRLLSGFDPEMLTSALCGLALEIDLGQGRTLSIPLYELPCAGVDEVKP